MRRRTFAHLFETEELREEKEILDALWLCQWQAHGRKLAENGRCDRARRACSFVVFLEPQRAPSVDPSPVPAKLKQWTLLASPLHKPSLFPQTSAKAVRPLR